MGDGYTQQFLNGVFAGPPFTGSTTTGFSVGIGYTNTAAKSIVPFTGIGSDSANGCTVYVVSSPFGRFTPTDIWVAIGGTMSTTTAPVFKFWRRPDATVAATAAGGTGDIAIYQKDGTTVDTMTIPKSGPVPIAGNVYVHYFTGDTTIGPGEAFVVEADVVGDAATTATIAIVGNFARFNAKAIGATTGVTKPGTSAIGKVYEELT